VLTWVSDHYATFGTKVIRAGAREGPFALDEIFELRGRDSDLAIAEHTIDNAGFTDLLFGAYDLVGLVFSPRIRNLADQRLWHRDDTALLRKRVGRQLNKGESLHALRETVHFAHHGNVRHRQLADQAAQALCLTPAVNCVAAFNAGPPHPGGRAAPHRRLRGRRRRFPPRADHDRAHQRPRPLPLQPRPGTEGPPRHARPSSGR